jgi:hypothetical protein
MKRVIRYAAAAVALGALLFPLSASAWGNRSWWRADYYDAYGARIGAEGRYCWGPARSVRSSHRPQPAFHPQPAARA